MRLNDTTTLQSLFSMADEWAAMPASSLSGQQIALINFKNAAMNCVVADKNGGAAISAACFICVTGA